MAAVLTWEPLRQRLDGFSSKPEPKELSLFSSRPGIGERSFPITQYADRGIKERSNFVYLAFFLNFLNEHFEIRQPIGHCGCAHLKPLGE